MKLTIKDNSKNYTCTVVEIKELIPIEGADRIQRAIIFSNNVIVSKDVKIGDKMLYFPSGTKLNPDFCKYNNLLTDKEQNRDNTKVGYISHKQFRVKAVKLRGVISDGILLPLDSLTFAVNYFDSDFKVGTEFTDIDNISICEKYFVPIRNSNLGGKQPKSVKINRLVDNQFYLHNDTDNLVSWCMINFLDFLGVEEVIENNETGKYSWDISIYCTEPDFEICKERFDYLYQLEDE